jgi:hypothetical protein
VTWHLLSSTLWTRSNRHVQTRYLRNYKVSRPFDLCRNDWHSAKANNLETSMVASKDLIPSLCHKGITDGI